MVNQSSLQWISFVLLTVAFFGSTTEYFTSALSSSHCHIFLNVFKVISNKEKFPSVLLVLLSSSILLPPPLNVSHFSNFIFFFFFLTTIPPPHPVPRTFLSPWHIEKCSCEDEYEHLPCYQKFWGAPLGCSMLPGKLWSLLRFLSMLIKKFKRLRRNFKDNFIRV